MTGYIFSLSLLKYTHFIKWRCGCELKSFTLSLRTVLLHSVAGLHLIGGENFNEKIVAIQTVTLKLFSHA